ncbi:MAG: hypothetical protein HY744_05110 [Deltaproteobacteria bacterium]|nr:hypothetical protein [Deltaproteobacteria bacterium]
MACARSTWQGWPSSGWRQVLAVATSAALATVAAAARAQDEASPLPCAAGQRMACRCWLGARGVQQCAADGRSWSECACGAAAAPAPTPTSAAPPTPAAPGPQPAGAWAVPGAPGAYGAAPGPQPAAPGPQPAAPWAHPAAPWEQPGAPGAYPPGAGAYPAAPAWPAGQAPAPGVTAPNPPAAPAEPSVWIGPFYRPVIGVAGPLRNPEPAHVLGVELAVGERIRFHLAFGYEHLNDNNGLHLDPAGVGFPLRVADTPDVRVEVEPVLTPLAIEWVYRTNAGRFEEMHALLLSSAVCLQAVFGFGHGFVAFTPVGLEMRFFEHEGHGSDSEAVTAGGAGLNWRLGLAGGGRF